MIKWYLILEVTRAAVILPLPYDSKEECLSAAINTLVVPYTGDVMTRKQEGYYSSHCVPGPRQ